MTRDSEEIRWTACNWYVGPREVSPPGGLATHLLIATLLKVSPMPARLLTNAKHWRDRAEEARATAERMTDPKAERVMLAIAIGYERLAERAEERQLAAAKKLH